MSSKSSTPEVASTHPECYRVSRAIREETIIEKGKALPSWHAISEFFLLRSAEREARAGQSEVRRRAREQLEHAVLTMRTARDCEAAEMRLELARRGLRELARALATSKSPGAEAAGEPNDDEALSSVMALPGGRRHHQTIA